MKILSVDPGLEKTGYALFIKNNQKIDYITSGLIKTSKFLRFEIRLEQIYKKLNDVINTNKPEKVILEQIFFFKNQKTAIKISQAQGVIILLASQKKIKLDFLTPLQIKQAVTGYGLSNKKSVHKMILLTLKLKKTITEDDEVDAIACGLAYCYLHK